MRNDDAGPGISWLHPGLFAGSLAPVAPDLAFNTAASFTSNTNWQAYGGETTMSCLTQMLGMTGQNFVSAATGMAILAALVRGLARHSARTIGNFWVDLTRSVLYILPPLSIVGALILVSQGVVQTFRPYQAVQILEPVTVEDGALVTEQVIAVGPAASQDIIKQLGTNGGGFFNVNSDHPLENPTPLSNFVEMLAILLIPTTIGGLLSAIGIAGMDRLIRRNVIALSGRAMEAAGDVDVLLLDKTGTITLGNRQAVDFIAMPESAILSAVIFNALIIVALIPLALRGVPYRPVAVALLLRDNLLVYGLGGLVAPFIGIKLIDLILTAVGLA